MNFLIADDEFLSRISVQKALNDCGISNQNIITADCGNKMIELLQIHSIQVALVDIKMPDISGLEAIKRCQASAPDTSFYILTGFEKFEYAAEAIHLGVKDFLLKPLDVQTLSQIIEREKQSLDNEKQHINNFYSAQITKILLSDNQISNTNSLLCLPYYLTSNNIDNCDLECLNQVTFIYPNIHIITVPLEDQMGVVFCTDKEQPSSAIISFIKETVAKSLHQRENQDLTIFNFDSFISSSVLKLTFDELKVFSSIRIIYGMHRIFTYSSKIQTSLTKDLILAQDFTELYNLYMNGSYIEFSNAAHRILNGMENSNIYNSKIKLANIVVWHTQVMPLQNQPLSTINDFPNYYKTLAQTLLQKKSADLFSINRAINYIKRHYMEDISIISLSSELHVSPNYLSTKFKKETGIKFIDYITNLRLSKSKQLLIETDMQIKEISAQVGYLTTSHFIRTFVKQEGITPLEFRNKNR
ncbi:response regulator transcription factor [Lacrimispora sp.]|uniref:response regulator transcription factor n=1 Tax=Lacrimispora sp. TaxID=2719234 RepID=UPI0028A595C3|nr:helix-turn-helix domain-containing protein [Lacrimispora sp.]